MSADRKSTSPPKTPTMPPRGIRRLSGSLILRFEEALKKLDEPAHRLDEVRAKTRDLLTEEEQKVTYPRRITLADTEEVKPDTDPADFEKE